ncbi:MAG: hypothetical protein G01um101420_317 [Parcubacteria group bacterium Gr01-1014_20]|nr:MAG: hypothetical protein G01um101420_317 [Parcubacteria group bacterium Gr01-1014_20]
MKYRNLGSSGLRVSEIGFGAWGIGGVTKGATSYGPVDDAESKKALRLAYDNGITLYDTAGVYGYGHSEELIGETFKDVRKDIVIATKVGFSDHNEPQNFSSQNIRHSLEESLRRLKTEYIDLYQLHSPVIEVVREEKNIIETLKSLKKEGKILAFGVSVRKPADSLIAVNELGFESVQVNFNMIDQRIVENGFMEIALEKNIGVVARTPLCFGFLTGKYSGAKFDPRDHRSSWPVEQIATWARAPELFAHINKGKDRNLAQLALQFCLAYKVVSAVIPGMISQSDVVENLKASSLTPLTSTELKEIERIYNHNEFFVKPKAK